MASTQNIRITAQSLATLEAFSGLPETARERIAAALHGRHYETKKTIIRAQDRDHSVYFVLSGTVRITYDAGRGRQVSFRDMHAGEMFGELSALDGGLRSVEVIAQGPALVASMSDTSFRAVLNDHPAVAHYVLGRLVNLVRRLTDRVVEQATLGVNNRIHAELLRLARATGQQGNCITVEGLPTHDEIAARINTHREAVSHEFTRLKKAGIIRKEKHKVLTILDVERLERMVQDVNREKTPNAPTAHSKLSAPASLDQVGTARRQISPRP